jgi:uncharacterized membrane protein YgcG
MIIIAMIIALMMPSSAYASDFQGSWDNAESSLTDMVQDNSKVLSPSTIERINLWNRTSDTYDNHVRIIVITLDDVDNNADIVKKADDYLSSISFKESTQRSIALVVATNLKKYAVIPTDSYTEVGDVPSQTAFESSMITKLRAGDFDGAVNGGVDSLSATMEKARGDSLMNAKDSDYSIESLNSLLKTWVLVIVKWGIALLIFVVLIKVLLGFLRGGLHA